MKSSHIARIVLASAAVPRGLIGLPRAESEPAKLFAELRATLDGFIDQHNSRLGTVEAAVNTLFADGAARALFGQGPALPEDPDYTGQFQDYVRSGAEGSLRKLNSEGYRANIHAALSVGTASEGGYLAPTEWDRQVRKKQLEISPMRRICSVVTTSVAAFSTVWHDGAWGSGWVGETAARPATTSPGFSSLEFASGEIYANVPITQRLLDDSNIEMDSWITDEIGSEFNRQEGIAFISGNGTNKPFGLLTYITGGAADGRHPGGNLSIVNSGAAAAVTGDGLVDFAYSLPASYRQGAAWLMSSSTAASVAKLKDNEGNYLWREGLVAGQPATLLGYPVEIDEGMPTVAADALPIAFGNFQRGYLINDRLGTRILRDPYTNKPYVNFYATKRVGGGLLDPNAIRLLKIAA